MNKELIKTYFEEFKHWLDGGKLHAKFDDIKTNCGTLLNSVRGCSYHTAEANYKEYCEPFIGQLPTSIKDWL